MTHLLPASCEESLCAFVHERTGLRIHDHQLETLRRTVVEACARFAHDNCADYLEALRTSRANAPEHEHLIAGITVGESYFFRDQAQMDFLRRVWLPELIGQRRRDKDLYLRIWSAGCSDGQEIYSLAMMLQDLLPDIEHWNLHLLGTDINGAALARSMRGRYSNGAFRATPERIRADYFQKDGDYWLISPHLRRRIKFTYLNLNEDSFPSILTETNNLDLILCRNVFIYFDPQVVVQIMAKLHACLNPAGCLLLGTSDLMDSSAQRGFELRNLNNTFYLVRESRIASIAPDPFDLPAYAVTEPAAPTRDFQPVTVDSPAPAASPPAACSDAALPGEIIRLLGNEDWPNALAAIELRQRGGDDSALIWQFRAKALANLGRAREALDACEHSLERDPTDKHSHFLRALVLLELNRLTAAEEALKRTLYLDHNFVEAHFQLGLLRLRRDERASGMKSLRNALLIADSTAPERRLHDAAGMNHGRMAAILRNELDIYGRTSRKK